MASRKTVFVLTLLAVSAVLVAQDVPVRNWTVPTFDKNAFKAQLVPLTHTQGDNPAVFVPLGPCRLTDSRVSSGGPGPISPGSPRTYDFVPSGCPAIAGLQAAQDVSDPIIAWSLNFTVVNTAGPGFLFAYPTGGTPPPVAILNYGAGDLRNNAAIVPVDASTGAFTVATGVNGTDVIIDTNGLFLATLEGGTTFRVTSTTGVPAIRGSNTSGFAGGIGVMGESINYNGVWAQSTNQDGLAAFGGRDGGYLQGARHGLIGVSTATTGANYGVVGSGSSGTNGAAGVLGSAAAGGFTFGVKGTTTSTGLDSAGVKGVSGHGDPLGDTVDCNACFASGVRGVSETGGFGVLGITRGGSAVAGVRLNSADNGTFNAGYLGSALGYGVYALGGAGGTGAKFFVEPHPTDPSLVIKYISLEGPESGTYFRGKGKFQNGIATIEVPEDFRMVTDRDGLSIQVTPIGQMATVAVQTIDLDRIVVRGSRNVEFFYTVNGVRRSFKDHVPIQASRGEYAPEKAEVSLESLHYLSPEQKRVLIQNGTYKTDGTVNIETAHRLGWDEVWKKQKEARAPEPVPPQ